MALKPSRRATPARKKSPPKPPRATPTPAPARSTKRKGVIAEKVADLREIQRVMEAQRRRKRGQNR